MAYVNDTSLKVYLDAKDYSNGSTSLTWNDKSGNGNNAVLHNFGYNPTSGWNNGYLQTDGIDDCFEIASLNGFSSIAFTFELKFSMQNSGVNWNAIFHLWSGNNRITVIERDGSQLCNAWLENSIHFNFGFGTTFHVLQCRSDGTTYQLYLDGTKIIDRSRTAGLLVPTLMRCSKWDTAGGYINGQYNLIRIYNRALTDSEITQNYNDIIGTSTTINIQSIAASNTINCINPIVLTSGSVNINISPISAVNSMNVIAAKVSTGTVIEFAAITGTVLMGNNSVVINDYLDVNMLVGGSVVSNINQVPTSVPAYTVKSIIIRSSVTTAYNSGQIILPDGVTILPTIDFSACTGLNLSNRVIEITEAFLISNNDSNKPFIGYIDFFSVSNPSVDLPLADYVTFIPIYSALINNFVTTLESMNTTREFGTKINLTMQTELSRKCTLDAYGRLYFALIAGDSGYIPASGENLTLILKFYLLN